MYYYLVRAICGHVRRGNGIEKCFAIVARNGKEAASICRNLPRVKHDNKHAILETRLVTEEEYLEQKEKNDLDPYFKAKNRRESYLLNVDESNLIDMSKFIPENRRRKDEEFGRNSFHGISEKRYVNRYVARDMEEYYAAF